MPPKKAKSSACVVVGAASASPLGVTRSRLRRSNRFCRSAVVRIRKLQDAKRSSGASSTAHGATSMGHTLLQFQLGLQIWPFRRPSEPSATADANKYTVGVVRIKWTLQYAIADFVKLSKPLQSLLRLLRGQAILQCPDRLHGPCYRPIAGHQGQRIDR